MRALPSFKRARSSAEAGHKPVGATFCRNRPSSKGKGVSLQIMDTLAIVPVNTVLPVEDKRYRINDDEMCQRQCVAADLDGYLLRFCQRFLTRHVCIVEVS